MPMPSINQAVSAFFMASKHVCVMLIVGKTFEKRNCTFRVFKSIR